MKIIKISFLILMFLFSAELYAEEMVKTEAVKKEDYEQSLEFPPPLNTASWSTVYTDRVPIGDIIIEFNEDEEKYRIEAHVISAGLIKVFTKYNSRAIVSGIKKDGRYIPQNFNYIRRLRDKTFELTLKYDEEGNIVSEEFKPQYKKNKYPSIKPEIKNGTPDPLTLLLVVRQHLFNKLNQEDKNFILPVYDGRQLSNMYFDMSEKEKVYHKRKKLNAYKLTLDQKPVGGFRDRDLEDLAVVDPVISFYLHDENLLPVIAEGESPYGDAVGRRRKLCYNFKDCYEKYKD